jgi:linoleoyl-CoA desaturase
VQAQLSPETLAAFAAELDALRERVMSELGASDARYIRRVVTGTRLAEVSGRALLFAGLFPPAWGAGVALLSLAKILENMEIGHNVLHGQYDWLNDPALSAADYEWDWACPAAHWRHAHNFVHHTFTNVLGKDRDLGYGLLRMADEQPWHPLHVLQPVFALAQALTFEWAVAVHDLELDAAVRGDKSLRELARDAEPVLRKLVPQLLKDYVWFPLLAGPAAPAVLTGNLSANLIRNVWAFSVIYCGHFPDGVDTFQAEPEAGESHGAWYFRQVRGSANCQGAGVFHLLSGHLSYQVEHHLFPDMPASRYREISGEVRAICERYGVQYNTGRFSKQLGGAFKRVLRGALPPRAGRTSRAQHQRGLLRHADQRGHANRTFQLERQGVDAAVYLLRKQLRDLFAGVRRLHGSTARRGGVEQVVQHQQPA